MDPLVQVTDISSNQQFQVQDDFEDRSQPRIVSCSDCSFVADCERRLKFHRSHFCIRGQMGELTQGDPRLQFQCQICEFKSSYGGKIDAHLLNYHTDKGQTEGHNSDEKKMEVENTSKTAKYGLKRFCLHCNYETQFVGHLVNHLLVKHKKRGRLELAKSEKGSQLDESEKRVVATIAKRFKTSPLEDFDCRICNIRTRNPVDLIQHLICNHSKRENDSWDNPEKVPEIEGCRKFRFCCDDCQFETISEINFKLHKFKACPRVNNNEIKPDIEQIEVQRGERQLKSEPLDDCSEIESNEMIVEDALNFQNEPMTIDPNVPINAETKYLCQQCGRNFTDLIALSRHYAVCRKKSEMKLEVESFLQRSERKP